MDSEPESVKQDVFLFPIFMLSYLQALVILKVKSMKSSTVDNYRLYCFGFV